MTNQLRNGPFLSTVTEVPKMTQLNPHDKLATTMRLQSQVHQLCYLNFLPPAPMVPCTNADFQSLPLLTI